MFNGKREGTRHIFKKAFCYLSYLIFPGKCLVCGRDLLCEQTEGIPLCSECRVKLVPLAGDRCQKCGRLLISELEVCTSCRNKEFAFKSHKSLFVYRSEIKELIYQYKFRKRRSLANWFASLMSQEIDNNSNYDLIVPVPPNPATLAKRGFDQVNYLSRLVAARTRLNSLNCLAHRKGKSQKSLNLAERLKNIEDLFYYKGHSEAVANKRILLIDDIFTTGATLHACAKILLEKKAASVTAMTIAQD